MCATLGQRQAWGRMCPAVIRHAVGMSLAFSYKTPCFELESIDHPLWRRVEWDKRKNEQTGCKLGKASLSLID